MSWYEPVVRADAHVSPAAGPAAAPTRSPGTAASRQWRNDQGGAATGGSDQHNAARQTASHEQRRRIGADSRGNGDGHRSAANLGNPSRRRPSRSDGDTDEWPAHQKQEQQTPPSLQHQRLMKLRAEREADQIDESEKNQTPKQAEN